MPVITNEKPVLSRISDEMFARLQVLGSLTGSIMRFDNIVRSTKLASHVPKHGLVVLTRGESVRVQDLDCIGNPPAIAYKQTFLVRVNIAPSEHDPTPVELYEDVAEAEVIKAIKISSDWHQFDGNSVNAEFLPQVSVVSDGGYDGIAIPIDVTYRITEGDPYEARS
jgi:hypothetical protein